MMPGASASFGSEKSLRSTRLYPVDTAEKSEDADCSIVSSDLRSPRGAAAGEHRFEPEARLNRAIKSW